ncbi:HWE histidine kinase domain-containing protein [Roseomonas sp. AR75]|uniref:HWE histidine kinase domain-containing protein n=1 Tax=Roseomonas sp. AR75 TaxID=2562311 RepID=UPI0010C0ADA4|nr:HWE histidine kinase domain-containing protein [Roseomonas sp. AR75]
MDHSTRAGAAVKAAAPLRRRLPLGAHLLLLTLAVLLPALLAGGLTAWQLGSAYRQVVETALQGGARTLAVAADREIDVAVTAVTSLAASRAVRDVANGATGGQADTALADLYERARAVGNAFGGWMLLVRADGSQLFNTLRPLGAPLPVANGRPWIDRAIATGAPVVSDLFTGSVSAQPILVAAAPVAGMASDPPRRERLALILAFDPARLAALLAHVRAGEIAGLIQVSDGRIIARSVGHAEAIGQVAPGWIAQPLGAQEVGIAAGPSLEGSPMVGAFHRLERVPWAVVVTAPAPAHVAAWRRPVERLAVGGVLLLAIALPLAFLLARRLLGPLQALAREADAVAAGHPAPPRAPPAPVAEFEALRHALARAAEAARARAVSEGRAAAAEEAAGALRTERDRARLYFDVARAMLVVLGPDGTVRSINREGLAVLGLEREEEAVGRDWFANFLPLALRAPVRAVFDSIATAGAAAEGSHENAVLRADGTERLVAWRNTVLRDEAGRLLAVVASGEDITERRAAEQRQTLLMREVDHRAKNALAVVQSILRLTRNQGPQDFAAAVEGRVNALARAHTLLARERWAGGDLRELAEAELEPYAEAGRLRFDGPPVRLAPEAVQPVSLVLHELATNAAKHGALSHPGGRIALRWAPQPGGSLRLDWAETGQSEADFRGPPTRRGFGTRMIVATVTGQLAGHVDFDWRPDGLRCGILIGPGRIASTASAGLAPSAAPAPDIVSLDGRRILVVEDEPLVAMDVEQTLRDLGAAVIGPAGTVAEALRLVEQAGMPDAAVLDVNLGGQAAFPVADLLVRRGVPVLFATGYGELPEGWSGNGGQGLTALLRKPVGREALAAALGRLLAAPTGTAPAAEPRQGTPPREARHRGCS